MKAQQKITYCLWFNKEAEEAANFYTNIFKNSKITDVARNPVDTPSGPEGSVLTVGFNIEGQQFMGLNGGLQFKMNPSISFFVHCSSADEVQALYHKLSDGGMPLMPLDKYPFSDQYAWIQDKYGLSWQLMLPKQKAPQKVMPSLLFVNDVCGKAEEAIHYYTSIFHNAKTGTIARYPAGMKPDKEESIMYADFMLEGQWFGAMDSAHKHPFNFNEGISFVVHCDTQQEIDDYWKKLSSVPQAEMCGWLKDKYGVSWQIVPANISKLLQHKDREKSKRVMQALMQMKKLDIEELENA